MLAESPYTDGAGGPQTQQTVLRRTRSGAWVFDAGTFHWPLALGREGYADARIQAATAALLARIAEGDGLAAPARKGSRQRSCRTPPRPGRIIGNRREVQPIGPVN